MKPWQTPLNKAPNKRGKRRTKEREKKRERDKTQVHQTRRAKPKEREFNAEKWSEVQCRRWLLVDHQLMTLPDPQFNSVSNSELVRALGLCLCNNPSQRKMNQKVCAHFFHCGRFWPLDTSVGLIRIWLSWSWPLGEKNAFGN
jgi:hypothetical protein